jgi:hypothetical protein
LRERLCANGSCNAEGVPVELPRTPMRDSVAE